MGKTNVLVAARIQATFYQGTGYVQLVPCKIQVLDVFEAPNDEADIEDVF